MKFFAAVLTIFFLFTLSTSFAQVKIGPVVGVNFANVKFDPEPTGVDLGARTGFLFGAVVDLSFTPIVGIRFEPTYVQKGSKYDIPVTQGTLTGTAEIAIKAAFLEVPAYVVASFGAGPAKPYIMAGPFVSFLMGDVKQEIEKATLNGQDVTNQIPANEREEVMKSKSTDFGINLGAGIEISLVKAAIFLEGQYSLGLSDLNDDTPDPGQPSMTIKPYGIYIKAGAMFSLN